MRRMKMTITLGKVNISEVLPFARNNSSKFTMEFFGESLRMGNRRLRLFKRKGCKCVKCGIVGQYFSVERPADSEYYQLVLYAFNQVGDKIPMTIDHKFPRSKGGRNWMKNLQPMCYKCNAKKADKI